MSWNSNYQNKPGAQGAQPAGAYPWGQSESSGTWKHSSLSSRGDWDHNQDWPMKQDGSWGGMKQEIGWAGDSYGSFNNSNGASSLGQSFKNGKSFSDSFYDDDPRDLGRGSFNKSSSFNDNYFDRPGELGRGSFNKNSSFNDNYFDRPGDLGRGPFNKNSSFSDTYFEGPEDFRGGSFNENLTSNSFATRGGANRGGNTFSRGGNTFNRGGNTPTRGGSRGGNNSNRGGNTPTRGGNAGSRGSFRGGSSVSRGGMDMARGSARGGSRGGAMAPPSLMDQRGGFGGRGGREQGFGLSSLGDLVNVAKYRADSLHAAVEAWQYALARSRDDDPVSALHSAKADARIQALFVDFRCGFLCMVGNIELFSGIVTVNDYFLARGLGAGPQACKVDTYGKAFDLLLNTEVDEVLAQEDVGEHMLKQEVYRLFDQNPRRFMAMVQDSTQLAAAHRQAGYGKREGSWGDGPDAKRPHWHWQSNKESLAPTKKIGILMNKNDPLKAKLIKLKELLKEEGITKLHIVPKIDQIAHKTAINIKNVYRYAEPPMLGLENKTPTFVEIFFDNVFMARGELQLARNAAMHSAYQTLVTLLCDKPPHVLATNQRHWKVHMEKDPDICHVTVKWQGDDNNCLLTSNLANMKQMMTSMPDFSVTLERLIITEHEADQDPQSQGLNFFKVLELSCTRNLVLLECEIVRNPECNFTCKMSLNGTQACSVNNATKNGAKRLASEKIMKQIQHKNDYIYVHKDYMGRTITKQELIQAGTQLKNEGYPPSIYVAWEPKPKEEGQARQNTQAKSAADKQKADEVAREAKRIENLQENIALRPLIPWMAAAFYQILDEHFEKVSLEDIIIDTREMARTQFEMITHCAAQMGLRVVNKLRAKTDPHQSLLRRTMKASDIHKMLQLHNGRSGRYEMKKLVHKTPAHELEQFKHDYLTKHRDMQINREDPNKQEQTATQARKTD